ncbi:triosephosphate isomerase [Candidatus Bathyarchaeota archaeon]|nr:triosephosphate isomerase [Candidatus Bathyarchaeota archaeon]
MVWSFKPPVFIVSTKAYLWGKMALKLAKIVEEVSKDSIVNFIFIPQLVDLRMIAEEVDIPIFAPNIDPIRPGRGFGHDLPEAVKEAGALGIMINHFERKKTLSEIDGCLERAREVGLYTIICCDTPRSAAALAKLKPDAILSELPSLIGSMRSISKEMKEFAIESIKLVKEVDEKVLVLLGAGITCGEDVAEVIRLGADGSGASRAICESKDPKTLLEDISEKMEEAWKQVKG